MTTENPPRRVTTLFDVDNTLIDNDRAKDGLSANIATILGDAGERRFWDLYEEVRQEKGLVNIPLLLARYGDELEADAALDDAERRRLRFALAEAYPLTSFEEAMQASLSGGVLKNILIPV